MQLIGILLGFIIILFLNSKKINMGLSLLIGAISAGLLSQMSIQEISLVIYEAIVEPVTLQLIIVVTVISGLGYILKETGDLDQMIDSLISIVKNGKLLSMLLPALIGTLSVPGGAILSAPLINESGDRISLDNVRKTASNLFFRHIFLFGYPLYGALILTGELFSVGKTFILRYNALIMLAGIISAYLVFFNNSHQERDDSIKNDDKGETIKEIMRFFISFLPILVIIVLALLFDVAFHYAVFVGLLIAVIRKLPEGNKVVEFSKRMKRFVFEGVNYKMAGLIIGVMAFKSIVEASGAVNGLANFLTHSGVPLSLMITVLGLITGYLTGMTMAALGILAPIFIPLFPEGNVGPYISLLFTTAFVGYLISPIHLCLALTKEYFEVSFKSVYRITAIPGLVMVVVALLQVMIG
ncbi:MULTISPECIES: DUF401 family protein [unclassified Candidatus Frackibacter]|uniref:DUF401 family protein n=1 Tax=unclassified Candidatus Frackibacter TaxID=2648818 RepID=UPI000890CC60|nr:MULTISPECIES: DUF401 family protein [unclassified Candidatus Frackibacter]SDC17563.1 hypothetical protein SAMN04515661_10399 [Candidatus Frackibacter sp. WG11]SEM44353.1 hypothetical protein SAMN04488698_10441 [Candidatus Frackibacter sp. WG12]SFL46908.1 hypothetical protein SAMN04488699_10341 [Candidatus Frackibacter sp. WG13]